MTATLEDLKKLTPAQLLTELETTRKTLFDTRYQVINKQSKATSEVKKLRKVVAQILTLLNKKVNGKAEKQTEKTAKNTPKIETKALEETPKVRHNAAAKKKKTIPVTSSASSSRSR